MVQYGAARHMPKLWISKISHNTRQNYLKFEEVSPERDSRMITTTTISKGVEDRPVPHDD